jgi:hypothetical protein
LPAAWLLGAPLTFCWTCLGLAGGRRLRREAEPLLGPAAEHCRRIAQALGIAQQVGLAASRRVAQPVLIGLVRPLILLPAASLQGLTTSDLEMILWHELAHVRRWDNLVNCLQRTAEAALFFHPCVWWSSRQVRRDREACCDAIVVRQTRAPRAYAELLLAFAARDGAPLGLTLAQHPLGGRIRDILRLPAEPLRVSRSAALAALALLLAAPAAWLSLTANLNRATAAAPAPAAANNSQPGPSPQAVDAASPGEQAPQAGLPTDPQTGLPVDLPRDATLGAAGPAPAAEVDAPTGLPVETRRDESSAPPGPPLLNDEQQHAADLAYRLLGVELEPLTAEERERVAAFQFRNGLRVANLAGPQAAEPQGPGAGYGPAPPRFFPQQVPAAAQGLQPGDLLVGLQATAIESFTAVEMFLTSVLPDLPSRTPLKFYVVRSAEAAAPAPVSVGEGGYPAAAGWGAAYGDPVVAAGRAEPRLVRGRLVLSEIAAHEVWGGADAQSPWRNSPVAAPGDGASPPSWPSSPMPHELSPVAPVPPVPTPTPALLPFEGATASPLVPPPVAAPALSTEALTTPAAELPPTALPQATRPAPARNAAEPAATAAPAVDGYRYEGKTFEEWRDQWRYELSLERRLKAIQALSAFGGLGRGAEAADAIVEIAGQYDWTCIGCNEALTPLQNACLAAFSERYRGPLLARLPQDACRAALLKAARSDQRQLHLFVTYVLRDFLAGDLIEAWLELAASSDPQVRSFAYAVIRETPLAQLDPRLQQWVRDSWTSSEAGRVAVAWSTLLERGRPRQTGGMGGMGGGGMGGIGGGAMMGGMGAYGGAGFGATGAEVWFEPPPEFYAAVIDAPAEVQREARSSFRYFRAPTAVEYLRRLSETVAQPREAARQTAALRAIAALAQAGVLDLLEEAPQQECAALADRLEQLVRTAPHEAALAAVVACDALSQRASPESQNEDLERGSNAYLQRLAQEAGAADASADFETSLEGARAREEFWEARARERDAITPAPLPQGAMGGGFF